MNLAMMEFESARQLVTEGFRARHLVAIFGSCSVVFEGRATSVLENGDRLVLIKGDQSIGVHQNKLVRPINYLVNAQVSAQVVGNELVVRGQRGKPIESLTISFDKVMDVKVFPIESEGKLELAGSEKHLQELLAQDLSFIEPGLKPMIREAQMHGYADIIAVDKNGCLVIVEVKRRRAGLDAVSQLHRYREKLQKLKNTTIRGLLIAPGITESAKTLLDNYGMQYHELSFEVKEQKTGILGLEKSQTSLLQHFGD